ARIVPARDDSTCVRPMESRELARPMDGLVSHLEVRAHRPAGLSPDDLPVAARWGGDGARDNLHYISIRCGDAWCDVGRPGFRVPAGRPADFVPPGAAAAGWGPPIPSRLARVSAIPGWFDEQLLAVDGDGGLVASERHSILAPHPDLDDLKAQSDFTADWVLVARA